MREHGHRGEAIMGHMLEQERISMRQKVNACGEVTCTEPRCPRHLALVRDVSRDGVFFYCNLDPPVGADVTVAFTMPGAEGYVEVLCRGKVIRREEYPAGAAMGIAARLYEQEILPLI